jgi:hypothetical protein
LQKIYESFTPPANKQRPLRETHSLSLLHIITMDESQVQAQLQQMQNFIMQEAEDKASEIRNKAQEEFSIQKSNIVVVEKQKILKEYERKEKQIGVKKKMYVAKERFRNEVGQVDTRGDGKYILL